MAIGNKICIYCFALVLMGSSLVSFAASIAPSFNETEYNAQCLSLRDDLSAMEKAVDSFDELSLEQKVATIDTFDVFPSKMIHEGNNKKPWLRLHRKIQKLRRQTYYEAPLLMPVAAMMMYTGGGNPDGLTTKLVSFYPYFVGLREKEKSNPLDRFETRFFKYYHDGLYRVFEEYVMNEECKARGLDYPVYRQTTPWHQPFSIDDAAVYKTLVRPYALRRAKESRLWRDRLPVLEERPGPEWTPQTESEAIPSSPREEIAVRVPLLDYGVAFARYAERIQRSLMNDAQPGKLPAFSLGFWVPKQDRVPMAKLTRKQLDKFKEYRDTADWMSPEEHRKRRHLETKALLHVDKWEPQKRLVDFYLMEAPGNFGRNKNHPLVTDLVGDNPAKMPNNQLKLAHYYYQFRMIARGVLITPEGLIPKEKERTEELLKRLQRDCGQAYRNDPGFWAMVSMCEAYTRDFDPAEQAQKRAQALPGKEEFVQYAATYFKNSKNLKAYLEERRRLKKEQKELSEAWDAD